MKINLLHPFIHRLAAGLVLGVPGIMLILLLVPPGHLPAWAPWMLAGWFLPALYLARQYEIPKDWRNKHALRPETVIDRVTDAIVRVDSQWRFTLVDPRAAKIYGYSEEELLGRDFWEIFPEALDTRFEEVYRRVMQRREPDTLEAYNVDLDGWFCVEVYPDEDGGLSFYFRDISKQHALQEELQAERDLLQQTQRLAGAWAIDLEADEVSWTEEVYRIHELPVGTEVDLEEAIEFYAPEARERIRRAYDRAITEGKSYDLELPIRTAQNNRRWVRTVGAPSCSNGEVVKVAGAIQDITERREAEQQNRLLGSALEAAANAIIITDPNGIIEWVNPAFTELTGYTADEAVGNTPHLLHSGKQDETFYEDLWETVRSGSVWQGELVNRRKDGSEYVEKQTITPVRGNDGDIQHFIAVKQDVTAQKQYEEELRVAKEEAEKMNRLKSSFLANMSHEIRTPLTSIIGYAELLRDQIPEAKTHLVERVEKSGHRLLRTLNSVLDLAQLESGQMKMKPETVDITDEMVRLVDSLQHQARRKNLDLRVDLPNRPLFVHTDKSIFIRILTNLLDNAIKFTKKGYVKLGCRRSKDEFVITVEDSGIGIKESFLDDLFKAFRQESTGLSRRYEGNGLGLALTKELVKLLNGTIDVESEKEKGTIFTVSFPVHAMTEQSDNGVDSKDYSQLPQVPESQHVLIVDDDPSVAELLMEMLPDSYTFDRVRRPDKAIALAERHTYDFIFLDINLKAHINGKEVRRQIEEQGLPAETQVIAITAYAMPDDKKKLLDAGFDGYLSKPFVRKSLYERLRQMTA